MATASAAAIEQLSSLNSKQTDVLFSLLGNDKGAAFKVKKQNTISAISEMETSGVASKIQDQLVQALENVEDNTGKQIKTGEKELANIAKMVNKLVALDAVSDEESQQLQDLIDVSSEGFADMRSEQRSMLKGIEPLGVLEKMSYSLAGVVGILDSPLLTMGAAGLGKLFGFAKGKVKERKAAKQEKALSVAQGILGTESPESSSMADFGSLSAEETAPAMGSLELPSLAPPAMGSLELPSLAGLSTGDDELDAMENSFLGNDNVGDFAPDMGLNNDEIEGGGTEVIDNEAVDILSSIDEHIQDLSKSMMSSPVFDEQTNDERDKREENMIDALRGVGSPLEAVEGEGDKGIVGMISGLLPEIGAILPAILTGLATGLVGIVVGAMGWSWMKGMDPKKASETTGIKEENLTTMDKVGAGGASMLADTLNALQKPIEWLTGSEITDIKAKDIFGGLFDLGGDFYEYVIEPISDALDWIKNVVKKWAQRFVMMFTHPIDLLESDFRKIMKVVSHAWDWISDIASNIFDSMSNIGTDILSGLVSALPETFGIQSAAKSMLGLGGDTAEKSKSGDVAYNEMNQVTTTQQQQVSAPANFGNTNVSNRQSVTTNNQIYQAPDRSTSPGDWELNKHAAYAGGF